MSQHVACYKENKLKKNLRFTVYLKLVQENYDENVSVIVNYKVHITKNMKLYIIMHRTCVVYKDVVFESRWQAFWTMNNMHITYTVILNVSYHVKRY